MFGGVQCYGREASDYTKRRLLGKTVWLERDVSDRDRSGRFLRYVWLDTELFNCGQVRVTLSSQLALELQRHRHHRIARLKSLR